MTNVIATTRVKTAIAAPSVSERLAGAAISSILGVSTMISLWSFAGLAGAVATNDSAGIARGLLTALTGI
jgi:hypothetical protein